MSGICTTEMSYFMSHCKPFQTIKGREVMQAHACNTHAVQNPQHTAVRSQCLVAVSSSASLNVEKAIVLTYFVATCR